METKQELLKQLSEAQGQLEELKKKIENYQEQKFEVGKWYKGHRLQLCVYKGDGCADYGFDGDGDWIQDYSEQHMTRHSYWTPATKEEVEEALIKEAKRRGFKEGVRIKRDNSFTKIYGGFVDPDTTIKKDDPIEFEYKAGRLFNYSKVIFQDGKWAEIIKEEKIEIGGYEVVKYEGKCGYPDGTEIDGNFFSWGFWEAAKLISEHSKAKIMVGCSKQFDVSLETIEKILKLKNK